MHKPIRLLVLFAIAVSALVVAQAVPSATPVDSAELREAVTVAGILEHEEAFGARSVAGERIMFARPGPELDYWEGEE